MTKKEFIALAFSCGYNPNYNGKDKTFYLTPRLDCKGEHALQDALITYTQVNMVDNHYGYKIVEA